VHLWWMLWQTTRCGRTRLQPDPQKHDMCPRAIYHWYFWIAVVTTLTMTTIIGALLLTAQVAAVLGLSMLVTVAVLSHLSWAIVYFTWLCTASSVRAQSNAPAAPAVQVPAAVPCGEACLAFFACDQVRCGLCIPAPVPSSYGPLLFVLNIALAILLSLFSFLPAERRFDPGTWGDDGPDAVFWVWMAYLCALETVVLLIISKLSNDASRPTWRMTAVWVIVWNAAGCALYWLCVALAMLVCVFFPCSSIVRWRLAIVGPCVLIILTVIALVFGGGLCCCLRRWFIVRRQITELDERAACDCFICLRRDCARYAGCDSSCCFPQ
jgi:hypothetical protein